ncbi:MAG: NAD(P)/FAD-dependent oxidoreductase [Clostridiales bacterium]|nr:NAD(P)/FAD-dependent oxidoreductase [Clostridiales bacterium]
MRRVIVIGGGASGMLAAGVAAKEGKEVILLEKNNRLGKKLYITGKGRCNLTNFSDAENLIKNTVSNPYFLYSAFYTFGSEDIMKLVEDMGVKLKVERGNRVFPKSDKSSDVIKALSRFMNINGVKVVLNCRVKGFKAEGGEIRGLITSKGEFAADSYILATGGFSYPSTGSEGEGHGFASALGHSVTKVYPSLVGLKADGFCRDLAGLTLKNIGIKACAGGKKVYEDFGELLFTHTGVSGPVILSASRYLTKEIKNKPEIYIDFKPALSESELNKRILRDFEEFKNREFKNSLDKLLPKAVIPVVVKKTGIDENKQVNSVSREERIRLIKVLKEFKLNITGTEGFNQAVITCGGVDVREIDPSTMKSKIINNLLFAGEIIDVDALTGGYNLQIAFSTGCLAGINS